MPKNTNKRLDPTIDIYVRWMNDGTENIVSSRDLQFNSPLKKGSRVIMMWDGVSWEGTVVDFEGNCFDSLDDDSDDDIPLASIIQRELDSNANTDATTQLQKENQLQCGHEVQPPQSPSTCDSFDCQEEVWAACYRCECLLCFKHFEYSQKCIFHNAAFRDNGVDVHMFDDNQCVGSTVNDCCNGGGGGDTTIPKVQEIQIMKVVSVPFEKGLSFNEISTTATDNLLGQVPSGCKVDKTNKRASAGDESHNANACPVEFMQGCSGPSVDKTSQRALVGDDSHTANACPVEVMQGCSGPSVDKSSQRALAGDDSHTANACPAEFMEGCSGPSADKSSQRALAGDDSHTANACPAEVMEGCSGPSVDKSSQRALAGDDSHTANACPAEFMQGCSGPSVDKESARSLGEDFFQIDECLANAMEVTNCPSDDVSNLNSSVGLSTEEIFPDDSDSWMNMTIDEVDIPIDEGPHSSERMCSSSVNDGLDVTPEIAGNHAAFPSSAARVPDEFHPVDFDVDGEPSHVSRQASKMKNENVKELRNKGEAYISKKSKKFIAARKDVPYNSQCLACNLRKLRCCNLTMEERVRIRQAFYGLANLHKQREWIARHTEIPAEKGKRLSYLLPSTTDPFQVQPVCKSIFLSTLGITARQVRTVIKKSKSWGVLEGEMRGGRHASNRERDESLRKEVENHIKLFPTVESHYCRSSTRASYLSSDLNASVMFKMYKSEHPEGASYSFYRSVLSSCNLKFHRPKKDLCGLCDSFRRGTQRTQEELREEYEKHLQEKSKVRDLKQAAKIKAERNDFCCAVFDLQQVIYLPKSTRSELFYKRRLANFNFTIYDLGTKEGICFLSHEGQTRRGACEVSSHLHTFLTRQDSKGIKEVELYSDGCRGQNKNSVVPSMMMYFLNEEAKSVESITLRFFERNHGQSEGDTMHSVIEHKLRQHKELYLPAQLATLIKMAKDKPPKYQVVTVQSSDIHDWKSYGQRRGILRVRTSEDGLKVDWTKFKAIRVTKKEKDVISFQISHLEENFHMLRVTGMRRSTDESEKVELQPLYVSGPPRLSQGKYNDLLQLCSGKTPVISHPDYQVFYHQLLH